MIPAFANLFTGDLAVYGDRLVLTSDAAPPSAGRDLTDAQRLAELLSAFGKARYPGGDRRAIASLWAKQHFATLLPAFLAVTLIAGRHIDVGIESIGCTFADDGVTQKIHLRDAGQPSAPGDTAARLVDLIDGHLDPVTVALAAIGGVSKKVIWSNAGNMIDFIVKRIERALGPTAPIVAALDLMAARRLADSRPNPLFDAVRYLDQTDGPRRVRRVCCIRYLIADLGYCSTCPLPEARP